jgi:hypothetical protein
MAVTMQLAGIRGVYFPIDDESSCMMEYGIFELPVRINYLPVDPYGTLANDLLYRKVFQVINEACSIIIDTYEEEILPPEQINNAIAALKKLRPIASLPHVVAFIDQLINLLNDARKANRPVFFVF